MDKLGRAYTLRIQTGDTVFGGPDNVLSIELPTTIEFDIDRNFLGGGANGASFRIYNLSATHRAALRVDVDNYQEFRAVQLFAGYGDNLYEIFSGNVSRASSIREGTNFITTVECLDAGFAYTNGYYSATVPAGTPLSQQFQQMIQQGLPNVSVGAIGNFPTKNLTASSYSKPTVEILSELSGKKFFIDKGKAHLLNDNEYIAGEVLLVTPQTGLLQTPQLEEFNLHLDLIFEPRLNVGYLIQIQSLSTDKKNQINKLWRVNSVKHRGMISSAVCGEVITSISVNYGAESLVSVVSQS